MSTTERPTRAEVVRRLEGWSQTVAYHDCAYVESLVDTLIEGAREYAAELGRQDAELATLRLLVANQAMTIARLRERLPERAPTATERRVGALQAIYAPEGFR